MTARNPQTIDKAQIRRLIAEQTRAVRSKDVDGIMIHYATDVVFYDCKPPFQTVGKVAFRRIWEKCLPCFPDSFQVERRDLRIQVSGNLAFTHCLFRFTGEEKDHRAFETWLRSTVGYRRNRGKWLITHEHCSVPFDPLTSKAVLTLKI